MTALLFLGMAMRRAVPAVLRLSVDLGDDAALAPRRGASMALSPDGSRLAFLIGQPIAKSRLAVRRLDQATAVPLSGTDGAEAPFFSPDGKSIAFFAEGKLKTIDAGGGTPVTLCDAPSQREGSWGDDDNIVFAATNLGGLVRVPSIGGTPQPVTKLDRERGEFTHRYPQVLPGSQAVLFMNSNYPPGEGTIEVQFLKTGTRRTLVEAGAYARYLPSGHLVYYHRGILYAAPMNLSHLQLTGPPVPLVEDVRFQAGTGTVAYTFSQSGTFAYVATSRDDEIRPLALIDASRKMNLLPVARAKYAHPRTSPDGTRLAVTVREGVADTTWIYVWASRQFSRFAFLGGNSDNALWTPDGQHLIFSSDAQNTGPGIYWMRSDGAGVPQRLIEGQSLIPWSLAPRAESLIYEAPGGLKMGLWTLPLDWSDETHPRPGPPQRLAFGRASEAAFSPDGRWVAYQGTQSGLPEIFVRPFRGPGGPWQVSDVGGASPVWSRVGHELFYYTVAGYGSLDSRIMVADYTVAGDSFSPARARPWSDARVNFEGFELMPDGKRVVVIPAAAQGEPTHATFLLNFMDELRKHLPAPR